MGGAESQSDSERQSVGRAGISERSHEVQHAALGAGRADRGHVGKWSRCWRFIAPGRMHSRGRSSLWKQSAQDWEPRSRICGRLRLPEPEQSAGLVRMSRASFPRSDHPLFHLKAHIRQTRPSRSTLQHDGVAGLELVDGGAQRLDRVDWRRVQLMNDVAGLQSGVGRDQVDGAAHHDDAGRNPQRAQAVCAVRA